MSYQDKTILVIDDEETNINILLDIFDDKYDVIATTDSTEVLSMVEDEKIDLILLDIMMPNINGFDICKQLKQNTKTKEIPVIFITASTDENAIAKAYEVGGIDYIRKPFNSKEVVSRVETQLLLAEQKFMLQKNLNENVSLLNQYKTIVDKSSIVSKTNLKGQITYANDKFCQISGYSQDELIGQHHNIVRHEDVPSAIYKDLWQTIQNKQIWQGEVKNKKKDGSYYVVLSTVMPVLDSFGNIVEYMSTRYDITDIYNLRKEIEDTQKEVVFTMGAIGETRSKETGNHVKRVAEYSRLLGKLAGLDEELITLLADASPMHDIGKVAIPDNILNAPRKLTDEEFVVMRTHALLGYQMLKHSNRPLLKTAAKIALEHHERWDGNGYPNHLKGEEICIEGRITALADVFDALGSDRVYKQAWADEKIFEYFKEQKAKQFDPSLVDLFFDNLQQFLDIRDKFKDI